MEGVQRWLIGMGFAQRAPWVGRCRHLLKPWRVGKGGTYQRQDKVDINSLPCVCSETVMSLPDTVNVALPMLFVSPARMGATMAPPASEQVPEPA